MDSPSERPLRIVTAAPRRGLIAWLYEHTDWQVFAPSPNPEIVAKNGAEISPVLEYADPEFQSRLLDSDFSHRRQALNRVKGTSS
jgi:hypothetical protein